MKGRWKEGERKVEGRWLEGKRKFSRRRRKGARKMKEDTREVHANTSFGRKTRRFEVGSRKLLVAVTF